MKSRTKCLLLVLALFQVVTIFNGQADSVKNEFDELNKLRKERKLLVQYLVTQKLAIESPNGVLKLTSKLDASSKSILEDENENRMRMFFLIAESENRSPIVIGKEFYERRFGKIDEVELLKPKFNRLMRMDGSEIIGSNAAPMLAESYLKQLGYVDVSLERKDSTTKVIGRLPSSLPTYYDFIEIRPTHTGNAFKSDNGFGLIGGYCDVGMASRRANKVEVNAMLKAGNPLSVESMIGTDGIAVVVHPSNPIDSLTVYHVGLAFSGAIHKWSDFRHQMKSSVSVFATHTNSGTSDIFNSMVMYPSNLAVRKDANRVASSRQMIGSVAQQPAAIGFVSISKLDESVKPLNITSAKGSWSIAPTLEAVRSQSYPITRPLYLYLGKESNEFAQNFVSYAMSDQGQAIVSQAGLIGRVTKPVVKAEPIRSVEQAVANPTTDLYTQMTAGADRNDTPWNLRFGVGSNYRLAEDSVTDFNSLKTYLSNNGNKELQVIIIGFTDSLGDDWKNQELSKNRADVVAAKLRDWGLQNIKTAGLGKANPIGDNNTPEGRNKNRRVEIWIKRN